MARREDLALAKGTYAYVQNQDTGKITVLVGTVHHKLNKESERTVLFDRQKGKVAGCLVDRAIMPLHIIPSGSYAVVTNPLIREKQCRFPKSNSENSMDDVELEYGRVIHIVGPTAFALWPGQTIELREGHRLHQDQYLVVEVRERGIAAEIWGDVTGNVDAGTSPEIGARAIVSGTSRAFFIPPTGIDIVADKQNRTVRQSIVLNPHEYCVLTSADGVTRYVRSEKPFIPQPYETVAKVGNAVDLKQMAVRIRVLTRYETYEPGDERWLTRLDRNCNVTEAAQPNYYWPRIEEEVIEVVKPVNIAAGNAVYVRDVVTNAVQIEIGPRRLLLDPTKEQVLPDKPEFESLAENEVARIRFGTDARYVFGPAQWWCRYGETVTALMKRSVFSLSSTVYELKDGHAVQFDMRMVVSLVGDDTAAWFGFTNDDILEPVRYHIRQRLFASDSIEFDESSARIVCDAVHAADLTTQMSRFGVELSHVEISDVHFVDKDMERQLAERRARVTATRLKNEQSEAELQTLMRQHERESAMLERSERLTEQKDTIKSAQQRRERAIAEEQLRSHVGRQELLDDLSEAKRDRKRAAEELELWAKREARRIETDALIERINGQTRLFEAFQPQLVAALDTHGKRVQFAEIAKHIAPTALLQNVEVTDVLKRIVSGSALEHALLTVDKPNGAQGQTESSR